MNVSGPIIIIEDDADDRFLLEEIFNKLNYQNEVMFFADSEQALEFFLSTQIVPFLIISDINLPKLDGFQLRDRIRADAPPLIRCVPYLFFSTASSQKALMDAYELSVQGFFVKEHSYEELETTVKVIIDYWKRCVPPSEC